MRKIKRALSNRTTGDKDLESRKTESKLMDKDIKEVKRR
jgi:hypothetical protein